MNSPRKNLTESVLARAEAYRAGMLFDGVPKFSTPPMQMPAAPAAADAAATDPQAGTAPAAGAPGAEMPAPGGEAVVNGAIEGKSALQSLAVPQ
jgi:hypothetical protein